MLGEEKGDCFSPTQLSTKAVALTLSDMTGLQESAGLQQTQPQFSLEIQLLPVVLIQIYSIRILKSSRLTSKFSSCSEHCEAISHKKYLQKDGQQKEIGKEKYGRNIPVQCLFCWLTSAVGR